MATCRTCGKKYHACSSCGIEEWEWEWCTEKCRDADKEASAAIKTLKEVCKKLSTDELRALDFLSTHSLEALVNTEIEGELYVRDYQAKKAGRSIRRAKCKHCGCKHVVKGICKRCKKST